MVQNATIRKDFAGNLFALLSNAQLHFSVAHQRHTFKLPKLSWRLTSKGP